MAYTLPNGITASFSTAFSDPVLLKNLYNANPATAEIDGDTKLAVNDVWYVSETKWSGLLHRAGAIGPLLEGNRVTLPGIDTSDTWLFKPNRDNSTKIRLVTAWEAFSQSIEISTSGGEQQYYSMNILEDPTGNTIQIPTNKSPRVITFKEIYDHKLSWYKAATTISNRRQPIVLRLEIDGNTKTYISGYLSLNSMPKIASNTPMESTVSFSTLSDPTIIETEQ